MSRRAVGIAGGILLAGVSAIVIERLIVTDREAILMAAESAASALSKGDVDGALGVLHPSALTDMGDPAATKRALQEQLTAMPLDKVNFLVRELKVENGVGTMSLDVMILPKDPKKAGASAIPVRASLEWRKDGDAWKIFSAHLK